MYRNNYAALQAEKRLLDSRKNSKYVEVYDGDIGLFILICIYKSTCTYSNMIEICEHKYIYLYTWYIHIFLFLFIYLSIYIYIQIRCQYWAIIIKHSNIAWNRSTVTYDIPYIGCTWQWICIRIIVITMPRWYDICSALLCIYICIYIYKYIWINMYIHWYVRYSVHWTYITVDMYPYYCYYNV
jgi:hypothetical protein